MRYLWIWLMVCGLCGLKPFAATARPLPAAEQADPLLAQVKGKRLGLVVNHSSRTENQHLVDFLLASGQQVRRIFAPEHGFRGTADAGAHLQDGLDPQTGLPVVSLYGAQKKPLPAHLQDLDLLIFDIQDVGVRYYTYISTLHYLMQAAAEAGLPLLVLDRPNPNGDYLAGPLLEPAYQSFVGMHPIPLVHGLTVGELARMIVGEDWLSSPQQPALKLDLRVLPVLNYSHATAYDLPVPPSPNLPNARAVRLYPSLGLFEGTRVSVGRGTPWPFQVLGLPDPSVGQFSFRPRRMPGASSPPYLEQLCYGLDLRAVEAPRFSLRYLLHFYRRYTGSQPFFNAFFSKLAGTNRLQGQLEAGLSEAQISASWQPELEAFRLRRRPYLLYAEAH